VEDGYESSSAASDFSEDSRHSCGGESGSGSGSGSGSALAQDSVDGLLDGLDLVHVQSQPLDELLGDPAASAASASDKSDLGAESGGDEHLTESINIYGALSVTSLPVPVPTVEPLVLPPVGPPAKSTRDPASDDHHRLTPTNWAPNSIDDNASVEASIDAIVGRWRSTSAARAAAAAREKGAGKRPRHSSSNSLGDGEVEPCPTSSDGVGKSAADAPSRAAPAAPRCARAVVDDSLPSPSALEGCQPMAPAPVPRCAESGDSVDLDRELAGLADATDKLDIVTFVDSTAASARSGASASVPQPGPATGMTEADIDSELSLLLSEALPLATNVS
jgi:hypothetical protein